MKQHEQKVHINELKMLRWATGVTRLNKARNEYIRRSFKVTPIVAKMTESRMCWYVHVMGRDEEQVVRPCHVKRQAKDDHRPRNRQPLTRNMERAQVEEQTIQDRLSCRLKTRRANPK